MTDEPDWHPPHSHDPNPAPPTDDASFMLVAGGNANRLRPEDLAVLPQRSVADCYIVSTGHGTSGPFVFGGPSPADLVDHFVDANWEMIDIISADGFRARLTAGELRATTDRPILLALTIDGRSMTRAEGLVRLIVPSETDDALRQVKWIGELRVQ